ncbi:MAG: NUDIX domain-containing protein [Defluviitaleaceae bacterium]|nr:NUDIX domain-containing protein [Defluviitaleaceae bacterium]
MPEYWDILDENGNKTGRLHERGKLMRQGEYHLVVDIWIQNGNGEFLISKRAQTKSWADMWQTTGGAAITEDGNDSLTAALRETSEELGIALIPGNGRLFKRVRLPHTNDPAGFFVDVWIFRQQADISNIVFQPEETCGAMWADVETINRMIRDGVFLSRDIYTYLDELFDFARRGELTLWNFACKNTSPSAALPPGARQRS